MIEYFKKRKQFKKDIKGIFDNWKRDRFFLYNDKYCLWIANGLYFFQDDIGIGCETESRYFLKEFNAWQTKLLWKEYKSGNKKTEGRKKLDEEFNIN